MIGERQKPISTKKLESWLNMEPEQYCDEMMLRNFKRNKQLIDLSLIPDWVRENVMKEYDSQSGKGRQRIFNYFIKYQLKGLMESINDF